MKPGSFFRRIKIGLHVPVLGILRPAARNLLLVAAKPELDDIHPGMTPGGRDFYALVEVRVPFEVVEPAEQVLADLVDLAADGVSPAFADRGKVAERVHGVILFRDVPAEEPGAVHEMRVALAALERAVNENPVHDLPVKRWIWRRCFLSGRDSERFAHRGGLDSVNQKKAGLTRLGRRPGRHRARASF